MRLVDFNNVKRAENIFYGGDAGAKIAINYLGDIWLLKLPKSTRDYKVRAISYTTSPLSEYLGSQIYNTFNIPVHETVLGYNQGKIVVACKDFTFKNGKEIARLIPFHEIKNAFMSSDIESYSGTGSETLLTEVLDTIANQKNLKNTGGVSERFWDMFVIDAFIGNNDRNNGNWGLLYYHDGQQSLAPVFDNGNAFFNKRSIVQMQKRLIDVELLREDAYRVPNCAFRYIRTDNTIHKINPYRFINSCANKDCNLALIRFMKKIDLKRIRSVIDEVPEQIAKITVMPEAQKEFYLEILQLRYEEIFLPAFKKLQQRQKDHNKPAEIEQNDNKTNELER